MVGHLDASVVVDMQAVGSKGIGGRRGCGLPGLRVFRADGAVRRALFTRWRLSDTGTPASPNPRPRCFEQSKARETVAPASPRPFANPSGMVAPIPALR
jgi:hypothetical protein